MEPVVYHYCKNQLGKRVQNIEDIRKFAQN